MFDHEKLKAGFCSSKISPSLDQHHMWYWVKNELLCCIFYHVCFCCFRVLLRVFWDNVPAPVLSESESGRILWRGGLQLWHLLSGRSQTWIFLLAVSKYPVPIILSSPEYSDGFPGLIIRYLYIIYAVLYWKLGIFGIGPILLLKKILQLICDPNINDWRRIRTWR